MRSRKLMAGYSQDELDDVQAKWRLRFPPDLIDRLRERRPLLVGDTDPRSFDWVKLGKELRKARARVSRLFDQRRNVPTRVEIRDLSERAVVKLATERKHL